MGRARTLAQVYRHFGEVDAAEESPLYARVAVALSESDRAGLPPTFILNSDVDSLRASGEAYAVELESAGVHVLIAREDGTRHGHLNDPDEPAALASIGRMFAWLHARHDQSVVSE